MSDPDRTATSGEADTVEAAATSADDSFLRKVAGGVMSAPPGTLHPGEIVDGNYRVVRRLGAGGMGVVYLAHDLRLKRDVALKLHGGGAGGARLEREATAIAQFVHPNVVTVHQIGQHDGVSYVAMEYLDGGTARGWLVETRRTWREILAVYFAAARGLAAAHAAGMVHRDFKPENLLLGRDGRVRVADFGLVRATDGGGPRDGDAAPNDAALRATDDGAARVDAASPVAAMGSLTETGAVLGTPAYMAPEQRDGRAVGPAADQYALCAALWEALYGERPVRVQRPADEPGPDEPDERGVQRPSDERGVPGRIRRALERGLAADPKRRWPSMAALTAALSPPSRGRWIAAAAAVTALAAGATAFAAWPRETALPREPAPPVEPDPCAGAAARVDGELPAALIDRLRIVVASSGAPPDLIAGLDARLAGARPALAAAAQRVCRAAHVERTLGSITVPRAEACLTLRARATALLIDAADLAATDPMTYATRLRAVPTLDACSDPAQLGAVAIPSDDAAIRARALLWTAGADVTAARIDQAAALLDQARTTMAPTDRGAAALAQVVAARITVARQKFADAAGDLARTYHDGTAIDDPTVYLPALGELVKLHSGALPDGEAMKIWKPTAEAAVQKDLIRAPTEVADLHFALAASADMNGDGTGALHHAEKMVALLATRDDPDRAAIAENALGNALAAAGKHADSVAHYQRAVELHGQRLGTSHPRTIGALSNLVFTFHELGLAEDASAAADRLDAALTAARASPTIGRANALLNLGLVRSQEGNLVAARAATAAARAIYVELEGPDHRDVLLCDEHAALHDLRDGRPREALAKFERVLAAQARYLGPDHLELGVTTLNLANAALDAGELARAERAAGRALAIIAAHQPNSRRHVLALVAHAAALTRRGKPAAALPLATSAEAIAAKGADRYGPIAASVEIARAHRGLGRDLPAAHRRLSEARAALAALPSPSQIRLAEIDAMLADWPLQ